MTDDGNSEKTFPFTLEKWPLLDAETLKEERITQEEGGIVQHAEIERSEIIFTKEITDKLEELRNIGTDEAAIEAGKLLAEQIIENTIDNTGELLHDN